jgi:hypothetical protein
VDELRRSNRRLQRLDGCGRGRMPRAAWMPAGHRDVYGDRHRDFTNDLSRRRLHVHNLRRDRLGWKRREIPGLPLEGRRA